jgi:hypothetical protein
MFSFHYELTLWMFPSQVGDNLVMKMLFVWIYKNVGLARHWWPTTIILST